MIVSQLKISDKSFLLEKKAAHSAFKGKKYWLWPVFIFRHLAWTVSGWRCNKIITLAIWDFRSSVTVVSKHGSRTGYTSHRIGQVVLEDMSLPEHQCARLWQSVYIDNDHPIPIRIGSGNQFANYNLHRNSTNMVASLSWLVQREPVYVMALGYDMMWYMIYYIC